MPMVTPRQERRQAAKKKMAPGRLVTFKGGQKGWVTRRSVLELVQARINTPEHDEYATVYMWLIGRAQYQWGYQMTGPEAV